jgi:hypothetical protein
MRSYLEKKKKITKKCWWSGSRYMLSLSPSTAKKKKRKNWINVKVHQTRGS